HVRRVIVGLDVPIRAILENDHAFGPEDVANLTAAFEAALTRLGLIDRGDPLTTVVAKAIIQLAKEGERDPKKLCDGAVSILGKWPAPAPCLLPAGGSRRHDLHASGTPRLSGRLFRHGNVNGIPEICAGVPPAGTRRPDRATPQDHGGHGPGL